MYRNYRKIIRVKNQYLKMDLTSQNPKNKMHLAWKLVLTHLYTPDAIIIIYMTFQWYCRKLGIIVTKKKTEIKTMGVSFFFSWLLLC